MGGCASKSKVLKGDEPTEAPAPAPAPLPQKEEESVVKEAVVAQVEKEEGVADDDTSNKNHSLGKLFKESEEGKDSAEKETVKASDVPAPKEVEKTIPEDAPVKDEVDEVEKAPEVSPVPETETPVEKKTEEAKPAVVAENAEDPVGKSEVQVVIPEEKIPEEINPTVGKSEAKFEEKVEEKFETPREQEPAEFKLAAEKPEEKIVTAEEKKSEVKPAAEAQIPDKSEEKK